MKRHLRSLAAGFLYVFYNYFVCNVPCWTVRKFFYRLGGMKIGKHSRIMMKTIVTIPWGISIGNNTTINEYCYLDGRGGVSIGDNVNIALYSMIITGSHDARKVGFDFYTEKVEIKNDVWIAARAMVLNGCVMRETSILAAGSVLKPRTICDEASIWSGVPAECIGKRHLENKLKLEPWCVHLR